MKGMWRYAISVLVFVGACGTQHTAGVCCDTQEQCEALGVDDFRLCDTGQTCDPHTNQCTAAECSVDGECPAATPVCTDGLCYVCDASHGCPASSAACTVATQTCAPCTANDDCARFTDTPLCDMSGGECVQCAAATDCVDATSPVCDGGVCRACALDTECDSGACGDDGACVNGDAAIYLSKTGTDSGTCTAPAPCATFAYALSKASTQREHLVMSAGTYDEEVTISSATTQAPRIIVHGHGASLQHIATAAILLSITDTDTDIYDLHVLAALASTGVHTGTGSVTLTRVEVQAGTRTAIVAGTSLTLHRVLISHGGEGIDLSSASLLVADGLEVYNVEKGISDGNVSNASVQLRNVLIHDTTGVAIDLSMSAGTIEFATLADGGDTAASSHFVLCGAALTLKNSIVWTPAGPTRLTVSGCVAANNIIGPSSVTGMPASDPMFENENARDYHLMSTSPAIDMATSGPATDISGMPRPQGSGYDLGAYEYAP